MSDQLRILIVEDVPNDAELALRELKRAGIIFDARRVETAAEYRRELEKFNPQLILSDFPMPNFDGTEALAIARDSFPDIPFIFISGSIGEEHAIRALKQGANDYVMKTNLIRLSSAVERAIQEQRERSARRDAEYALRASELRKSAIFEAARDCIVTIDAQGRVIEFNPAAEKTFGYAREEVLGKELAELIIPAGMRASHRRGLKHYHATGEGPMLGRRVEVSAMRKDGTELPVELTVVPIRLPDQTLFSAHIRDVAERKRAEKNLLESEAKYRGLIEQASDGIFVSDAEGNLLLANSRWCELLGYAKNEVTGMNARETYLEEEMETHAKRLEQVRAGQTLRYERIVQRKDGSTFPAELSLKMLDNGLIQGIVHDITNRRAQEQKIARLSRIQAVLSGINSAIVRIRDRQELFERPVALLWSMADSASAGSPGWTRRAEGSCRLRKWVCRWILLPAATLPIVRSGWCRGAPRKSHCARSGPPSTTTSSAVWVKWEAGLGRIH